MVESFICHHIWFILTVCLFFSYILTVHVNPLNFRWNMCTLNPCGVRAKVWDCNIVVSEFKLQSRYYVHFWTNTFRKSMNSVIWFQVFLANTNNLQAVI